MKEVARREVTVTPEALEQIVNDAVTKAITAYEQARGATPDSAASQAAADSTRPTTARRVNPPIRRPRRCRRGARNSSSYKTTWDSTRSSSRALRPAPGRAVRDRRRTHTVQTDGRPRLRVRRYCGRAAAEPDAPAPLDIGSVTEWMNASAAAADVDQLRATAGGKAKTREGEQEFDWVAAELAALDAADTGIAADPPAAPPPDPEPPPYQAPAPVAPAIEQPRAASTNLKVCRHESSTSRDVARETRSGLAGWFRSALGDRSPQREPARVPVPGPEAPPVPASSVARQPEPEVEAPAPSRHSLKKNPGPRASLPRR